MFNKTSDGLKTYLDVFITFSLIFLEKSMQIPEKTGQDAYLHKKRQN